MNDTRPPFLKQAGFTGTTGRLRTEEDYPGGPPARPGKGATLVVLLGLAIIVVAVATLLNAGLAFFCLELIGGIDIGFQQALGVGLLLTLSAVRFKGERA